MTDYRYLPADALPDLLMGWVGPISVKALGSEQWEDEALVFPREGMQRMTWLLRISRLERDHVRLDTRRPEVRDHIARVLARGLRCPMRVGTQCGENIDAGEWIAYGSPSHPLRVVPAVCPRCAGTGYLRKPAPAYHLLDAERTGVLTGEQVGACLAWSVLSVARGGGVLRAIWGEWLGYDADYHAAHRMILCADVPFEFRNDASVDDRLGWRVYGHRGPEIGLEGRACTDATILRARFARLDKGQLTLPELPSMSDTPTDTTPVRGGS